MILKRNSLCYLVALSGLSACLTSCSTGNNNSNSVAKSIVFPTPNQMNISKGVFEIKKGTTLDIRFLEAKLSANEFVNQIEKVSGIRLGLSSSQNNVIIVSEDKSLPKEGYSIIANEDKIEIKASDSRGVYYAFHTLTQLLPKEIESSKRKDSVKWVIPCAEINDSPRFSWRGMHVDVSRHFFTVDEIKKFIDYMSDYKLNKLHLHLTDDQGWRIEIKKYPLLTEEGAWRTFNSQDSTCIERSKDNSDFILPEDRLINKDGKKQYGGFYTQNDIKEIVSYASEHYIDVVPEIDIPGHFKAAIDNYSYLSCKDKAGWGSTFSYPACLGKETTYEFIENILSEVAELFPYQYIHIGGDEVNTTEWKTCNQCQGVIKKNHLKDEHELQSFFNKRIEKFLETKGKRLLGWDEITQGGISGDATVMWWRNWDPKARNKTVDSGNDLIICPDFEYYFDWEYEGTPTKQVYEYNPIPEDFNEKQEEKIIGVQANLWSERIPSLKRLEYMAMPRMIALAETGWTEKGEKNWDSFNDKLCKYYDRLDEQGINYHIPSIKMEKLSVFTDKEMVSIDIPWDKLTVYYTLDGTTPNEKSNVYSGPFEINKSSEIKARAFYHGKKGDIIVGKFEKQTPKQGLAVDKNKLEKGVQRHIALGKFNKVDQVEKSINSKSSIVSNIELSSDIKNKENFGLVFNGYIYLDKDDIYTFTSTSDDGDKLYIDNDLVIDNGGSHAANKKSGMIALKAGYHEIKSVYKQISGGADLKIVLENSEATIDLSEVLYCKK